MDVVKSKKTGFVVLLILFSFLLFGNVAIANNSVEENKKILINACDLDNPYQGQQLKSGQIVCLPDQDIIYLSIPNTNNYKSIAITSNYGTGNLDIYAANGGWPDTNQSAFHSNNLNNSECIIIDQPKKYWTYLVIKGRHEKSSLVVDLGANACRSTSNRATIDNNGYFYDHVNVLVYRFDFKDEKFKWPTIAEDLEKVKAYYLKQSYGRFKVNFDLSKPVIQLENLKKDFDNDFHAWLKLWQQKVRDTGINPNDPGDATIIMMTAPQVGNFNSTGGPPYMSIYHYQIATVAHEIGHALGLRHAQSLEAGEQVVGSSNDKAVNYGNVASLMGMGGSGSDPKAINLMYKSYFGWLTEDEVPLIKKSGIYRIYAFDHGDQLGTNAPGIIGLRLKSGNGKYTYWVEYRTTGFYAEPFTLSGDARNKQPNLGSKDGVLINLQGYLDNEKNPNYWKHVSLLLDMTPNSQRNSPIPPYWWGNDETDAHLTIGKTYTDYWGGFNITPIAKGGTENTAQAWIDIKVDLLN